MTIKQLEELAARNKASTDSRIAFKRPEKPAGAFKSKAGRVVAPEDKSISTGFLEARSEKE